MGLVQNPMLLLCYFNLDHIDTTVQYQLKYNIVKEFTTNLFFFELILLFK